MFVKCRWESRSGKVMFSIKRKEKEKKMLGVGKRQEGMGCKTEKKMKSAVMKNV